MKKQARKKIIEQKILRRNIRILDKNIQRTELIARNKAYLGHFLDTNIGNHL